MGKWQSTGRRPMAQSKGSGAESSTTECSTGSNCVVRKQKSPARDNINLPDALMTHGQPVKGQQRPMSAGLTFQESKSQAQSLPEVMIRRQHVGGQQRPMSASLT